MMLRLPAAIRTAVALRSFTGATRPPVTVFPARWPGATLTGPHDNLQQATPWKQTYATVHGDELDQMWRDHGNNNPKTSDGNVSAKAQDPEPPPPSATADVNAALQDHLSTLDLAEAQELITTLHGLAKTRNSSDARRVARRKIREAVYSNDPLLNLRRRAEAVMTCRKKAPKIAKLVRSAKAPSADEPHDSGIDTSGMTVPEEVQLLDVQYIQRTMPLPTKEQYSFALDELFDHTRIAAAIHNQCQKRKLSQQSDVNFAPKEGLSKHMLRRLSPGGNGVVVCTLKLEISDLCTVTAFGEGTSNQAARQAAWLHVISKMHVDGTLKELFPDRYAAVAKSQMEDEVDDFELQPVELDEDVKNEEKDAKTEIYEYAASLGLVPFFETKTLQPRTSRARRGIKPKNPKLVWQVRIRLEGRNIDVSAIGKDLRTAEVAAGLAFKAEAEKQHTRPEGMAGNDDRRILTVETAKKFFDFYKTRVGTISLAVEHEQQRENSVNWTVARVTINGMQVGQDVLMGRKKEAESVAYLAAAVELTNKDPNLLREFEQTVIKGKGEILRPVRPIDFPLAAEVIGSMREALLQARKAGLSDIRQTLGAESSTSTQKTWRPRRRLSHQEQQWASEILLSDQNRFHHNAGLEELRVTKAALPIRRYHDQVLNMITENPYSIVVGATGSGKTTQVPQIIFENAIQAGHGGTCNIICTQPRRIAATSVAQRVADERNEPFRETVGYQVRFDSKPPYKPFGITYCTTGVLLEKLKHDPDEVLDTTSHICIDEVHERDMQIDFLMIVLKQAIKIRLSEGKAVPKIILMSATLDTELFANYFGTVNEQGEKLPCPALSVPGRTFPVEERHLDSIVGEMQQKHGSEFAYLLSLHSGTQEYLDAEITFRAAHKGESSGARKDSVIDWKGERQAPLDPSELDAAKEKEDSLVPVGLLAATIAHICKTTDDGAILAFLPGLAEILDTERLLVNHNPLGLNFEDTSKFQIFPLHSTSSREQQAEIFKPLRPGCRKIILATNIAETSVTVTDVKYVVDSGKLREIRYDQLRRITKLQCVWVSKSNAKQRAGRAGRVQDGYYYALYSKERSNALNAIGQPELLRSDLQETCLSIKAQNFNESVGSFLSQAIEPPSPHAVVGAIQNLIEIEAFTADEDLTALGRVLSRLPVHPSLGKMIILGVIFRCLDPMITLGAATNERSLFALPVGLRSEAVRAHKSYGSHEHSDQIALLDAFQELRMLRHQYGVPAAQQRASENFLHWGAFRTIDQSAKQTEEVLVECGLIPRPEDEAQEIMPAYGPSFLNQNAQNSALIKSLLVAGLNPNIGVKSSSNGVLYRTPKEQSVAIYPRSRNGEMKKADTKHAAGTLFTYSSLAKGTTSGSLFLRETSKVTPLMTLLFGGQLRLTETGRLEMDDWLPFFVKHSDQHFAARLLLEFRKALDRVLYRTFHSLEDLTPENRGQFVDDPVRDNFVDKTVQILSMREPIPEDAFKEWRNLLRRDGI
jgi:HrpA-like RNA helicase